MGFDLVLVMILVMIQFDGWPRVRALQEVVMVLVMMMELEVLADDNKIGGLIRMAEGGGPPKMAELSAKEAGSTFDISKYIDDEGRLVGGMSKPIRDAYGKIIGYESGDLPLPIQRDVVFGKELRDKEAAMRLTDAEREQMMIEMAMRQGRTGIHPTRGGLAGISADDLMPIYAPASSVLLSSRAVPSPLC
jgi:hypothetical protein